MESFVYFCYASAVVFHACSLFQGLLCVKHGEKYFTNSSPFDFFKSRAERKFWTVVAGIMASIIIIPCIIVYTATGLKAINTELAFCTFHFLIAFALVNWHIIILKDIKSGRICEPI